MFGFRKKETIDVWLPFRLVPADDDGIDIEAYGSVCCEQVYLYSTFMLTDSEQYENGGYERLLQHLKQPDNRTVKVTFTLKNDKPADGKLDLESLAEAYHESLFLELELLGWGLFPYSIYEKTLAEQAADKGV